MTKETMYINEFRSVLFKLKIKNELISRSLHNYHAYDDRSERWCNIFLLSFVAKETGHTPVHIGTELM